MNEEQRRAMEFIATVNRVGYRPTAREINEWRLRPDPKPGRKGKLLVPEVPGTPARRIRKDPSSFGLVANSILRSQRLLNDDAIKQLGVRNYAAFSAIQNAIAASSTVKNAFAGSSALGSLLGEYETIPGKPGKPAEYGPPRPPEKFLAHLRRLAWITRDDRRGYTVTRLGLALLEADGDDPKDESSSVILLAKGSELAYAKVFGAIGGCGDALVVDAYLGPEALHDLVSHTGATRFLVDHKYNASRVSELSVLMGTAPSNNNGVMRELRQADLHDRYLVGEDKVYSLTASLNGLGGNNSALLYELPDSLARIAREEVEDLWGNATVLARGLDPASGDVADEAEASLRVVREEDGRYLHDGCDVRHRKRGAADNCTNGT